MKQHVQSTINGEPVEFLCDPQQSLLEVLREELELTGTKEGCGTGDCGACSVMLDGRLVCSCLVFAAETDGREGLKSLEVLIAAYLSARDGKTVSLPLEY